MDNSNRSQQGRQDDSNLGQSQQNTGSTTGSQSGRSSQSDLNRESEAGRGRDAQTDLGRQGQEGGQWGNDQKTSSTRSMSDDLNSEDLDSEEGLDESYEEGDEEADRNPESGSRI